MQIACSNHNYMALMIVTHAAQHTDYCKDLQIHTHFLVYTAEPFPHTWQQPPERLV